jgi:CRISPR/Cas system-associated exonuclease Cas4 (RecB family)
MRTLRASELGAYLYCKRAWWYRSQGVEPQNQRELADGNSYHEQHGRKILALDVQRLIAWLLLAAAVILLVVWLTLLFLR